MRAWPDGAEQRLEGLDLEHENDAVTHDILHHLHARLAVLTLASGLDDVIHFVEARPTSSALDRVEAPMVQAIELGNSLAAAGTEIAAALSKLDRPDKATAHFVEVDRFDDEGDRILREGVDAPFEPA